MAQKMPGNDIQGGFSSHIVVPARQLCQVPVDDQYRPVGTADVSLAQLSVVADALTTPYQAIVDAGLTAADFVTSERIPAGFPIPQVDFSENGAPIFCIAGSAPEGAAAGSVLSGRLAELAEGRGWRVITADVRQHAHGFDQLRVGKEPAADHVAALPLSGLTAALLAAVCGVAASGRALTARPVESLRAQ